jgi:four helix bundle protein
MGYRKFTYPILTKGGTMKLQSYKDLRVWQQSMDLVETIYKITGTFPRQEQFGLASQMQRSAVSVPSNIAEGYTRSHKKEYLQFLAVSHGSLCELETQMEISYRLKYIGEEIYKNTSSVVVIISKQLLSLRRSLYNQSNTQHPIP